MKKLIYIIVIAILGLQSLVSASPKNAVNILTKYNYLRSPKIAKMIKEKCGVDISYDEYYASSECADFISESGGLNYYDIIIFPNGIYELFSKKIAMTGSTLNQITKYYNPVIKKLYYSRDYPSNVVYFAISVPGFIWNPDTVNISKDDGIEQMFLKAQNNTVILKNSRAAILKLIGNNYDMSPTALADRFKKIIAIANVYITNSYNKLYDRNNFAFAFQNSGDAIAIIKKSKNKKLHFLIHPKYSYLTYDVLVEINLRPETRCVAKILAGKEALKIMQTETFYLSPYETYLSVDSPLFQEAYKPLFDKSYDLKWFNPFTGGNVEKHNKLQSMWHKIHVLPQIMKNHKLILR